MPSPATDSFTIGLIGGTGPEGKGLATRLARAGYHVQIGSRSAERAASIARDLTGTTGEAQIDGDSNQNVAARSDVVILTIPYDGVRDTLPPLREATAGKIVVSAIAPLEFIDGRPAGLTVEAGSAAEEVRDLLPEARVVSAFQTVDAHVLQDLQIVLDTDVVVCSDDTEARRRVVAIANSIQGIRGLSGGRLSTSRYVEGCTALLIIVNRIYKSHSGIRITGVDR